MTRYVLPAALLLFICSCASADCPPSVHCLARTSYGHKYSGGLVGGGAALRGGDPYVHEGTWGVDYLGIIPIKRVWLGWSHGRYQAGGGKYDTERMRR
jgi:hypothetical protein